MRLYIAEKPSLGRVIAEALGSPKKNEGYIETAQGIVTWCIGHIMEQASPEAYDPKFAGTWRLDVLPCLPSKWIVEPVRPEPENPRRSKAENANRKSIYAQYQVIEKLVKDRSVTEIVNAGDPDREGQLIVDEVLEALSNKKPVLRIWLKALDPETIKKANRELKDNREYSGFRNAALSRSRADWLVGMNMTRAMTLAINKRGSVMSIGRVQTPVLELIRSRNEEIRNFRPKDYFVPIVTVETSDGKRFQGTWATRELPSGMDEEKRIVDRSVAETIARSVIGKTLPVSAKKENKSVQPPLPWSLSSLQVFCGEKYGLSPKKVLDAVQSLYEDGYVSYPRTDCEYLPESIHGDAGKILPGVTDFFNEKTPMDPSRKSKAWNDSKVTAHYAISPTSKIPGRGSLDGAKSSIYEAICRVYMAQFAPPLELAETKLSIQSGNDTFQTSGKVVTNPGWTAVWPHGGPKNDSVLPNIADRTPGEVKSGEVESKKTTPPKPFTESSIIEVMKSVHKYVTDPEAKSILKESDGIGTEATRAEIVNTLLLRGLISKAAGKAKDPPLVVTEDGIHLLESVTKSVKDPVLTAIWERQLSEMVEGRKAMDGFVEQVAETVRKWVEDIKKNAGSMSRPSDEPTFPCPQCGRPMFLRTGKFGKFWGCSGYRAESSPCQTILPDDGGKPGKPKEKAVQEQNGPPCPSCNKLTGMFRTSGEKPYYRCLPCHRSFWPGQDGGLGSEWAPMKKSAPTRKTGSRKRAG